MLRRIIRTGLNRLGYDPIQHNVSTRADRTMQRIASLCDGVSTIVDVGASDGRWSEEVLQAFPNTRCLLIEAQTLHKPGLDAFVARHPGSSYTLAAASDHEGSISFMDNGALRGGVSRTGGFGTIEVPCTRIDTAVKASGMRGPYLIKLDTHGHEVEILEGAGEFLAQANVVVIEAYNFDNGGRLVFYELCEHMARKGFRVGGISDVTLRPADDLFWQMDIWFLPASNRAYGFTGYLKDAA